MVSSYFGLSEIKNSLVCTNSLIVLSSSKTDARFDASGRSMITFFTFPFFSAKENLYPDLRFIPALSKSGAFKASTCSATKERFITMRIIGRYFDQTFVYIKLFYWLKVVRAGLCKDAILKPNKDVM